MTQPARLESNPYYFEHRRHSFSVFRLPTRMVPADSRCLPAPFEWDTIAPCTAVSAAHALNTTCARGTVYITLGPLFLWCTNEASKRGRHLIAVRTCSKRTRFFHGISANIARDMCHASVLASATSRRSKPLPLSIFYLEPPTSGSSLSPQSRSARRFLSFPRPRCCDG